MDIRNITKQQISKLDELSLIQSEDENAKHMCQVNFKKYGQLRIPTICIVDGKVRVVDGMKYLKTISEETNQVKVNFIGEIKIIQFMALRIYHNFQNQRVHYINMAEFIGSKKLNKLQRQSVANGTSLTEDEVGRYETLLTFDFEEYRRTPINEDQYKLL